MSLTKRPRGSIYFAKIRGYIIFETNLYLCIKPFSIILLKVFSTFKFLDSYYFLKNKLAYFIMIDYPRQLPANPYHVTCYPIGEKSPYLLKAMLNFIRKLCLM